MNPDLKNFKSYLDQESMSITEAIKKSNSVNSFTPGEIYSFRYQGNQVFAIVISTRKSGDGKYVSSRGNVLLTVIKLDTDLKSVYNYGTLLILRNLYKKQKEAKYPKITEKPGAVSRMLSRFFSKFKEKVRRRTVLSLFGKSNFRTYNISKMRSIYELNIDGAN